MQKWEYCIITGSGANAGGFAPKYPQLIYFSPNGIETWIDLGNSDAKKRPSGWRKVGEAGYVAHTIAELGLEVWEMVGVASQEYGSHSIYFRRPVGD